MTPSNHRNWGFHRVLSIPELLDLIFELLDKSSNARNARVCKTWSSRALDAVWRDMDNLRPLFSLLAPLKKMKPGYKFSRLPNTAGWKRFEFYGLRVRRLQYRHPHAVTYAVKNHDPEGPLQMSVFEDVSRTCKSSTILPNMDTLKWDGPLDLSIMFMHQRLKMFEVTLPNENFPRQYFNEVVMRMPNLIGLHAKSSAALQCEEDVTSLVTRLPKLQDISFPLSHLVGKLMEVLSARPDIGKIDFQYLYIYKSHEDVVPSTPALAEGAFPALRKLCLTVPFEDFLRFFSLKFAPRSLTTLCVVSGVFETATSWQTLLAAVANNCQLLEDLGLRSLREYSPPTFGDPISFEHLKCLFNLSNLKALDISHPLPLVLNQMDLESLAMAWPNLEKLNLNDKPCLSTRSNLSIKAFLPFARHCPKLTDLRLFLNAARPPPLSGVISFKYMKWLSMGGSTYGSLPRGVSVYLDHLVPAGCLIIYGNTVRKSS